MNDLSEAEIHALNEALDDEYRAWATYDQVIADFGNGEMYDRLLKVIQHQNIVAVLCNLQEASQQRHLAAFRRCAQRSAGYGRRGPRPSR